MKTSEKLNSWLDVLNDVSAYIEQFIMTEEDKDRIIKLDKVIDQIYELSQALTRIEPKDE